MRTPKKTLFALCLSALLGTFAAPDTAEAQQRPQQVRQQQVAQAGPARGGGGGGGKAQAASKVQVNVMVVHATEDGKYIDPKLKEMERHLQHLKYSNYSVLNQEGLELSKDNTKKMPVEGGREVTLTLLSTSGDKARIRVRFNSKKKGSIADATVVVPRGRTFVVSGPEYDGGILLIPITAKF